jgi:uncharacterized membrane protein YfcA
MNPMLAAACIAMAALFVRGFTGFGSALIMTPLLLFFFDIKATVVATAIVEILGSFWVTVQARKDIDSSHLRMLLPVALLGMLVGWLTLITVESGTLKRVFGTLTVLFAVRMIITLRRPDSHRKRWPSVIGYLAGAMSGLLGGLFGTAGPPIVVFLENQTTAKAVLRATLLAYFLAVDVLRMIPYAFSKLITNQVLEISAAMFPASLIGAYLGRKLQARVSESVFRLMVGAVLLATGVLLALGE